MVSTRTAEEALAALPPEERRWIEEFRDQLRAMLGDRLRDLRLYGSKARGDWHDESDIDLLVLVDAFDWRTWERILALAHDISSWLTPMIMGFDEYHAPPSRATGFYKEMRKESIRL